MSEPKWEDVEVGDAIIAEIRTAGDATLSGTVCALEPALGFVVLAGNSSIPTYGWTLLDIIKPEPQLPTTPGSVIACGGFFFALDPFGWFGPSGYVRDAYVTGFHLVYDAGKK